MWIQGPCPCFDQSWTSNPGRPSPRVWNYDRHCTEMMGLMSLGAGAIMLREMAPRFHHKQANGVKKQKSTATEEARLPRRAWNTSPEKGGMSIPCGRRGTYGAAPTTTDPRLLPCSSPPAHGTDCCIFGTNLFYLCQPGWLAFPRDQMCPDYNILLSEKLNTFRWEIPLIIYFNRQQLLLSDLLPQ